MLPNLSELTCGGPEHKCKATGALLTTPISPVKCMLCLEPLFGGMGPEPPWWSPGSRQDLNDWSKTPHADWTLHRPDGLDGRPTGLKQNVIVLTCGHMHHAECVRLYMDAENGASCPICRKVIGSEIVRELRDDAAIMLARAARDKEEMQAAAAAEPQNAEATIRAMDAVDVWAEAARVVVRAEAAAEAEAEAASAAAAAAAAAAAVAASMVVGVESDHREGLQSAFSVVDAEMAARAAREASVGAAVAAEIAAAEVVVAAEIAAAEPGVWFGYDRLPSFPTEAELELARLKSSWAAVGGYPNLLRLVKGVHAEIAQARVIRANGGTVPDGYVSNQSGMHFRSRNAIEYAQAAAVQEARQGYELLDLNQTELEEMDAITVQAELAAALQERWKRTNAWIVLKVEYNYTDDERTLRGALNDYWKNWIRDMRAALGVTPRTPIYTQSFLLEEETRTHPDFDRPGSGAEGLERKTFGDFLSMWGNPVIAYSKWMEAR